MKRIAEGREAEILEHASGDVVKLYRAEFSASAEQEWLALTALAPGLAPAPVERLTQGDRVGIRMERVVGVDALTIIGTRPWRLVSTGRMLGRAHARVHESVGPAGLPRLHERLRERIGSSGLVPATLGRAALSALDRLPAGDRLCHGDFHPANVIVSAAGARVIDWPNAAVGDAHADVASAVLILRLGEVAESSPWGVRLLHRVGRGALISSYLTAYGRARPLDHGRVREWMLPVAVERLAQAVPGERERLLTYTQRLLTYSA